MNKTTLAAGALAALILGACATTEGPATERIPAAEREYATGSHMPRRAAPSGTSGDVQTYNREALERERFRTAPAPEPRY